MNENMETKPTMDKDNIYGILEIPSKHLKSKVVEKYWGHMATLFQNEMFCLKEIFMRKGTQSSMEFHCTKKELYYIQEGKLKVGMKIGRGENKSLTLEKGDVFEIKPGLMHMRIALEDTTIIEVATHDQESDSHIVHDGKQYTFKEE
jgi:mannose-6-phosphate isomerase-like protein (cupin superfamily)